MGLFSSVNTDVKQYTDSLYTGYFTGDAVVDNTQVAKFSNFVSTGNYSEPLEIYKVVSKYTGCHRKVLAKHTFFFMERPELNSGYRNDRSKYGNYHEQLFSHFDFESRFFFTVFVDSCYFTLCPIF